MKRALFIVVIAPLLSMLSGCGLVQVFEFGFFLAVLLGFVVLFIVSMILSWIIRHSPVVGLIAIGALAMVGGLIAIVAYDIHLMFHHHLGGNPYESEVARQEFPPILNLVLVNKTDPGEGPHHITLEPKKVYCYTYRTKVQPPETPQIWWLNPDNGKQVAVRKGADVSRLGEFETLCYQAVEKVTILVTPHS